MDLAVLEAKYRSTEQERSLLTAADRTFWTLQDFERQGLAVHPDLAVLSGYVLAPPGQLQKVQDYLERAVGDYHAKQPLAPGPSKETLRAACGLPPPPL